MSTAITHLAHNIEKTAEELIKNIDHDERTITFNLPEGLIEQ